MFLSRIRSQLRSISFGFIIMVLLTGLIPNSVLASPPTPIELKQQLQSEPLWEHKEIYEQIMNDTSVLDHPALRKQLVKTAEEWNEKLIRGRLLGFNEGFPNRVDRVSRIFKRFRHAAQYVEGKDGVKIWINIMPNSPIVPPPEKAIITLKKNGEFLAKEFLSKAKYGRRSEKAKTSKNAENRAVLTDLTFPRVLYESIRLNWSNFPEGLRKNIQRFANQTLKVKEDKIQELKVLAVSHLLDQNLQFKVIKQKFAHPSFRLSDGTKITSDFIRKRLISDAQNWRQQYPKWPVDESKVDKGPPGHDRDQRPSSAKDNPPGHKKDNGKGHR